MLIYQSSWFCINYKIPQILKFEVYNKYRVTLGKYGPYKYQIHSNKSIMLTKTCRNELGIIKEKWLINGTTRITLPITYTITSRYIKSMFISVFGSGDENIKVEPAIMAF